MRERQCWHQSMSNQQEPCSGGCFLPGPRGNKVWSRGLWFGGGIMCLGPCKFREISSKCQWRLEPIVSINRLRAKSTSSLGAHWFPEGIFQNNFIILPQTCWRIKFFFAEGSELRIAYCRLEAYKNSRRVTNCSRDRANQFTSVKLWSVEFLKSIMYKYKW